mgnify:CR=1 FL=1
MTYYSKKRGVKKSFKNRKVKSRLSFKNKNKKNKKNKKPRTRRRNRRLNGGTFDDILKTLYTKGIYTKNIFNKDKKYAEIIVVILLILRSACKGITLTGEDKKDKIDKIEKYLNTNTKVNTTSDYVKIFLDHIIDIHNGGANGNPNISKPITVQINDGSIKVDRKVVNSLRQKLSRESSIAKLNSIVDNIVPEVQPSASGAPPPTRLQSFETIKAELAAFKAVYERDRSEAELAKLLAAEAQAAEAQAAAAEAAAAEERAAQAAAAVDPVDLLSRHVVDHIVEKNLSAIDEISNTRSALFDFLQREGREDTIASLAEINALLE